LNSATFHSKKDATDVALVNIKIEQVIGYSAIIIDNIFAIGKTYIQEFKVN